jgi:hypothetical protein
MGRLSDQTISFHVITPQILCPSIYKQSILPAISVSTLYLSREALIYSLGTRPSFVPATTFSLSAKGHN